MLNRIKKEIERVAQMNGVYFPSDESVTIELTLSDEQKDEFLDLDLDNRYWWELEDNTLTLTYSDDSITLDQVIENIWSLELTGLERESDIINEIIMAYQDYQVHGVSEVVVSCEHKNNGRGVYQVYQSYINHADSPILKTVVWGDIIVSVEEEI